MLKKSFVSFSKFRLNPLRQRPCQNQKEIVKTRVSELHICSFNQISFKSRYHFARRLAQVSRPIEPSEGNQQKVQLKEQQPQMEQKAKEPYYKATQNYTFSNLDADLEMYQGYLNIFNTHTKKAHDKLIKNEIKIIQLIIDAKRQDLLAKFLSTNYRNRLANPQTLPLIAKHYVTKIRNNIDHIISSSSECQLLLQTISLLTEFHELQAFAAFIEQLNKKYGLSPQGEESAYLIKLLKALPSAQSQFLTLYNFLFKNKELPPYLMDSQFFGMHTENLKFNHLGQTFYEIRKFMRRYFAFYSKKPQIEQNSDGVKIFERQHQNSGQGSSLETDVRCFLKALNYKDVRSQIQIDGFIVDFVIQGVTQKQKKFIKNQSIGKEMPRFTILEVMGSYHYTARGKLKGRDVRKLVLLGSRYRQKRYNVKLIHYEDLNKSKGFRNKMELIRTTLEQKGQEINWEPENKGFSSQWQLKEHYEEFK